MFASITNNTTCSQNSRNNRRNLGILAAPVVAYSEKKNIRISYVNWGSRHSGIEDDVDDDVDADEDSDDVDADDDVDDVDDADDADDADVDDDTDDDEGGKEGSKEGTKEGGTFSHDNLTTAT